MKVTQSYPTLRLRGLHSPRILQARILEWAAFPFSRGSRLRACNWKHSWFQVPAILPCRRHRRPRFSLWVGKIPWRRAWQPTPALLPGESHGLRSLAGYSQWDHKESDMTEVNGHTLSTFDRQIPCKTRTCPGSFMQLEAEKDEFRCLF